MTTNPLRADELRERFSKQHEKWLIGTDDDAEAAQEWCMENLPSLLALLTPPPSLASTISGTGWRPEVRAFADLMEAKLRENDHKPGWKGEDPRPLLRRLNQEFNELETVISKAMFYSHWKLKGDPAASWPQPLYEYRRANDDERSELEPQIGGEAADVANFAMMIADVCGALPQPKTGDA